MRKKIFLFRASNSLPFHEKFPGRAKILSFLLILVLLGSCAVKEKSGKKSMEAEEPTSSSPYYYYLESRNRLRQGHPLEALGFLRHAVALDPESVFLYQELTAILVHTGQPHAALQSIDRARELDPEDSQTLLAFAGIKQMLGHDIREIIPIYEKVLQLDPDQENIYLLLGNLYFSEKEPEKAEAIYKKLIARNPENPNGYYYLGQLQGLLGKNRKALANFDKAIEKAPYLLEPRIDRLKIFKSELAEALEVKVRSGDTVGSLLKSHLGQNSPALRNQVLALNPSLETPDHLKQGTRLILPPPKNHPLVKKIRDAYTDLLEKNPYSSELTMEYALFCWKTGDIAKAKNLLLPMAGGQEDRDNTFSMIHAFLGRDKNHRDALFLLESMSEANPQDKLVLYHMGLVYDGAGMEKEAREVYKKIPTEDPVYVPVLKHLAHMDVRSGNMEDGLAKLETAWRLDETDLSTCSFLAGLYAGEEQLLEAEKLLYACLELDPNDRENRYRLGAVLHKQGEVEASIREMEILVLKFPEDAHALNFLGYTLTEENRRLDEAEKMIRKALELAPEDGYIVDSMGWICMKQGKFAEALFYLEKAVELVPEDAVIWEHLGDAYLKVGELKKAKEAYTKSVSLKENPIIIQKINKITLAP